MIGSEGREGMKTGSRGREKQGRNEEIDSGGREISNERI